MYLDELERDGALGVLVLLPPFRLDLLLQLQRTDLLHRRLIIVAVNKKKRDTQSRQRECTSIV